MAAPRLSSFRMQKQRHDSIQKTYQEIVMPIVELAGIQVEVDEDGFIQDPACWNENVAMALAKTEDVEALTEDHWKVVNYLRKYYQEFGIAPMVRKVCKETGFDLKTIYELFPSGPAKGACKVAGLPKPTGCV
jgi:tRNA 2-thiouridine synthesizing protein E